MRSFRKIRVDLYRRTPQIRKFSHLPQRNTRPCVALYVVPLGHNIVVPEAGDVQEFTGFEDGFQCRGFGEALFCFEGGGGAGGVLI